MQCLIKEATFLCNHVWSIYVRFLPYKIKVLLACSTMSIFISPSCIKTEICISKKPGELAVGLPIQYINILISNIDMLDMLACLIRLPAFAPEPSRSGCSATWERKTLSPFLYFVSDNKLNLAGLSWSLPLSPLWSKAMWWGTQIVISIAIKAMCTTGWPGLAIALSRNNFCICRSSAACSRVLSRFLMFTCSSDYQCH